MSWRDNLYPASFRGVRFYVEGTERDSGRRQVVHRFPGKKLAFVQDLGEDSDKFTVDAYVILSKYGGQSEIEHFDQRDALERVLVDGSPGKLVHPWRGTFHVAIVGRIRTKEANAERGMARISFDCIEVEPDPIYDAFDLPSEVKEQVKAGKVVTGDAMKTAINANDMPNSFRASSRDAIGDFSSKLNTIYGRVSSALGGVSETARHISDLGDKASDLLLAPTELADAMFQATSDAFGAAKQASAAVAATINTFGTGAPIRAVLEEAFDAINTIGDNFASIGTGTTLSNQEKANRDAIEIGSKMAVFYEAANSAAELPFESRQQALAARASFISAADGLMGLLGTKEYQSMRGLLTSLGEYLNTIAKSLPETGTFTPKQTLPALVIAQAIYGDATLSEDLVIRNRINNPNFITADEPLEILNAP